MGQDRVVEGLRKAAKEAFDAGVSVDAGDHFPPSLTHPFTGKVRTASTHCRYCAIARDRILRKCQGERIRTTPSAKSDVLLTSSIIT